MTRWSDVPECGGIFHSMRTLTPFGARMGSRAVPTNAKRLNIGKSCLDHSDSGTVCAPARPFISFLLAVREIFGQPRRELAVIDPWVGEGLFDLLEPRFS